MGEKYIPVVIVITVQRIITLQRKTCVNSYIPPRNSLSYESLPPSCFRKISAVLGRLKCPEFLAMIILMTFFLVGCFGAIFMVGHRSLMPMNGYL